MSPIHEGNRVLTPADYLGFMKETQGNRPDVWARSLAGLVTLGLLPEKEASKYARELVKATEDKAVFWSAYNTRITKWKESKRKRS